MALAPAPAPNRQALFAAVLTPAAVVVGWLVYFAISAGWGVLYAALFGAIMALLISAIEHYVHTAKREAAPDQGRPEHHAGTHAVRRPDRAGQAFLLARAGAIMFTFVAIVCEDLAKELVREMLRPCLLSVITLLPVAVAISAMCERDDSERTWNPIAIVSRGLFLGLIAACLVALVRLIAGEDVQFWATWGWWALVGLGFSLVAVGHGPSPWRPVVSVLVALVIVILWARFTPDPKTDPSNPGSGNLVSGTARVIGLAVDHSLQAPDLPSHMWTEAKAEADQRRARHHASLSAGQEPHEATPAPAPPGSELGQKLAAWCGCPDPAPTPPPVTPESAGESRYLGRSFVPPVGPAEDTRQSRLCRELRQGLGSGLFRSWLVMFLFAVGLGLSPAVEQVTRPADYPSSRTRVHDRILAWSLVALVVGGALVVRMTRPAPAEAPSEVPAARP